MKVKTSLEVNGINIIIFGEYIPASKGFRDSLGVPEEPDYDAEVFIDNTFVDGKDLTTDEIAEMLEMKSYDLDDMFEEAILNKYHDDKEAAAEARAIDYYESKKLRDENY